MDHKALNKLNPHCPKCLSDVRVGDLRRNFEREDFAYDIENATKLREIHCWNCGDDYLARFYEEQS